MKYTLLALGAACAFYGCAGAKIAHTDVATGAYNPKAIYIRSYIAENAPFRGHHGDSVGEHKIRKSLAPAAFSKALKEEMEKIAPAMVLTNNDEPADVGWLVESEIEYASAGSQTAAAAEASSQKAETSDQPTTSDTDAEKKKPRPLLAKYVGRVTVLLPPKL